MIRLPCFVALLVASCGGSAPPAETPKHEIAQPKQRSEPRADEEATAQRSGPSCDDGSCFACGDAVCLSGFYCAVGKSGRGCAWLPSCPGKPTCACVAPTLREEPSCACQEKEGAVFVVCDGARL
jgi:hypothetical protein